MEWIDLVIRTLLIPVQGSFFGKTINFGLSDQLVKGATSKTADNMLLFINVQDDFPRGFTEQEF